MKQSVKDFSMCSDRPMRKLLECSREEENSTPPPPPPAVVIATHLLSTEGKENLSSLWKKVLSLSLGSLFIKLIFRGVGLTQVRLLLTPACKLRARPVINRGRLPTAGPETGGDPQQTSGLHPCPRTNPCFSHL